MNLLNDCDPQIALEVWINHRRDDQVRAVMDFLLSANEASQRYQSVVERIARGIRERLLGMAPRLPASESEYNTICEQVANGHGYTIVERGVSTDGEKFVRVEPLERSEQVTSWLDLHYDETCGKWWDGTKGRYLTDAEAGTDG